MLQSTRSVNCCPVHEGWRWHFATQRTWVIDTPDTVAGYSGPITLPTSRCPGSPPPLLHFLTRNSLFPGRPPSATNLPSHQKGEAMDQTKGLRAPLAAAPSHARPENAGSLPGALSKVPDLPGEQEAPRRRPPRRLGRELRISEVSPKAEACRGQSPGLGRAAREGCGSDGRGTAV